tara:strand:+ start:672 stop:1697 length:1026 start_codon:yes stop_codon:yes gene_type:complete
LKILHIVGARPQFMKLVPLLDELKNTSIESKILHTGQHFDKNMSDIFFEDMNIPEPDFNLNLSSSSVGLMLDKISEVLQKNKFDSVLVYGDTNSTIAGALSARQLGLKVIHYEAGVRNLDPQMPEEINRIVVDRISDILFCVSDSCVKNLENESLWFGRKVFKTGDLMYDCFLRDTQKDVDNENYVYVTIHRANNTDNEKNLKDIINALNKINENKKVKFPMHPRTKKMIDKYKININFDLIEPVGYFKNLKLIKNSDLVLTDSGGVVKEAYWSKKTSILLMKKPVWPELVDLDSCINIKSEYDEILKTYDESINMKPVFDSDVYGVGNASKKIAKILCEN